MRVSFSRGKPACRALGQPAIEHTTLVRSACGQQVLGTSAAVAGPAELAGGRTGPRRRPHRRGIFGDLPSRGGMASRAPRSTAVALQQPQPCSPSASFGAGISPSNCHSRCRRANRPPLLRKAFGFQLGALAIGPSFGQPLAGTPRSRRRCCRRQRSITPSTQLQEAPPGNAEALGRIGLGDRSGENGLRWLPARRSELLRVAANPRRLLERAIAASACAPPGAGFAGPSAAARLKRRAPPASRHGPLRSSISSSARQAPQGFKLAAWGGALCRHRSHDDAAISLDPARPSKKRGRAQWLRDWAFERIHACRSRTPMGFRSVLPGD